MHGDVLAQRPYPDPAPSGPGKVVPTEADRSGLGQFGEGDGEAEWEYVWVGRRAKSGPEDGPGPGRRGLWNHSG